MYDRLKVQLDIHVDLPKIRQMPDLKPDGVHPDMMQVQNYLRRFGYMPLEESCTGGQLDKPTMKALNRFQDFFGVAKSDEFTSPTRAAMAAPRCGLPDFSELTFRTIGSWNRRFLTFAFGQGTGQAVGVAAAQNAVRLALSTWENAGAGLRFLEVPAGQNPDIMIEWRPAQDPDHSMVGGVLAHADFPPGFSIITNGLPLPVHFDDTEHIWAVGNQFDIETVTLHEFGHILGMLHEPNVQGAVMFPSYSGQLRTLQNDDLNGIRDLYPATILRHGLRRSDGSWNGLNNKGDAVIGVDCAAIGGDLHVCGTGHDLRLWHGIRLTDGSWNGLNLKGDGVREVSCAAIGNELHVCAVGEDGALWHGIRHADGSWNGLNRKGDAIKRVDCAAIGNDLHVVAMGHDRRLWHGIRLADGSWNGLNQKGDAVYDVACATIGSDLHVCAVGHDRSLWHGIRLADGSWNGLNRKGDGVTGVDCAAIGDDLHVCGTGQDLRLWHGIRYANGSWSGLNLKGDGVREVSCTAIGDTLHVCASSDS